MLELSIMSSLCLPCLLPALPPNESPLINMKKEGTSNTVLYTDSYEESFIFVPIKLIVIIFQMSTTHRKFSQCVHGKSLGKYELFFSK